MHPPKVQASILESIGSTPLVQLHHVVPKNAAEVYVKLEYMNPTGSYKDRMALSIIQEAEQRGDLRPGMRVVEYTAGGTGTSLALICSIKGYPFIVVSSDAFAKEKLQTMRLFGAQLELVPSEGGIITPDLIPRMIKRAEELASQAGSYWTNQFVNTDALEGYRRLGEEIIVQLEGQIDVFCAAVGTAGMLTGTAQALRKSNPAIRIVVLEPASSPVLSRGVNGNHHIEGICPGFVPPLLEAIAYDQVRTVEEAEARMMAKRLAAEEGIFAGTSSGVNVVAAIELATELGPGHRVVTVACDSGLKYMSGGLFE